MTDKKIELNFLRVIATKPKKCESGSTFTYNVTNSSFLRLLICSYTLQHIPMEMHLYGGEIRKTH